MLAVRAALADAGEPLDGLQLWQLVDEHYAKPDAIAHVIPGELE